jgi:hypothetical protein
LNFAESVQPGEVIEIEFSYGGQITQWPEWSANVMGPEWTEIGLYFPWFPFNFDLGTFTYDLEVVSEPGYSLISPGQIRTTDSGWSIACPHPTNDLIVCLATDVDVHTAELGHSMLRIYHFDRPQAVLEALSQDIRAIVQAYNHWYGPVQQGLCVVESRRERGGGYGRIGGIFLGGFDGEAYLAKREGYNRYLAHEIAHQWWHSATSSSWEDWLNESFAEYSALAVIRLEFGVESFNQRLDEKRSASTDTAPIWGFDRDADPDAEAILYSKGPVLLFMLEERMGRPAFQSLCAKVFLARVDSSVDYLELLEAEAGQATRRWFAELLKTY